MGVLEVVAGGATQKIGCGGSVGTTGRLRLYAGGLIWQEACDDTGFLDLFERTSSTTPGSDYLVVPYSGHTAVWGTDGEAAYLSGGDDGWNSVALYNTPVGTSGYVEGAFSVLDGSIGLAAAFTTTSPFGVSAVGHGIFCTYQTGLGWLIIQQDNGSHVEYTDAYGSGYANGDIVRLSVSGGTATLHVNEVLRATITLAWTVPSGAEYWGMHAASLNSARIDTLAINRHIGRPLKLWDGPSIRTIRMTPA